MTRDLSIDSGATDDQRRRLPKGDPSTDMISGTEEFYDAIDRLPSHLSALVDLISDLCSIRIWAGLDKDDRPVLAWLVMPTSAEGELHCDREGFRRGKDGHSACGLVVSYDGRHGVTFETPCANEVWGPTPAGPIGRMLARALWAARDLWHLQQDLDRLEVVA